MTDSTSNLLSARGAGQRQSPILLRTSSNQLRSEPQIELSEDASRGQRQRNSIGRGTGRFNCGDFCGDSVSRQALPGIGPCDRAALRNSLPDKDSKHFERYGALPAKALVPLLASKRSCGLDRVNWAVSAVPNFGPIWVQISSAPRKQPRACRDSEPLLPRALELYRALLGVIVGISLGSPVNRHVAGSIPARGPILNARQFDAFGAFLIVGGFSCSGDYAPFCARPEPSSVQITVLALI